jgi:hypothetical protein
LNYRKEVESGDVLQSSVVSLHVFDENLQMNFVLSVARRQVEGMVVVLGLTTDSDGRFHIKLQVRVL